MPLLERGGLKIEYTDEGTGAPVLLVHSSPGSLRMWKKLAEQLRDRFRVLTLNRYGVGGTTPWPSGQPQSLADQARLVELLCDGVEGPLSLVGHSMGGAAAMKAALRLGDRVARLVLLEPSLFAHLRDAGRQDAFEEICRLGETTVALGNSGEWDRLGQVQADYWNGPGTWAAMTPERKAAFAQALRPCVAEWGMLSDRTPVAEWRSLPRRTLLARGSQTHRPFQQIVELLLNAYPHWESAIWAEGGHMGPVTRPDQVNPLIIDYLSR